jgi:hypothetical protein
LLITGIYRLKYWVDRKFAFNEEPATNQWYEIDKTFTMPAHNVTLHAYYQVLGTLTWEEFFEAVNPQPEE